VVLHWPSETLPFCVTPPSPRVVDCSATSHSMAISRLYSAPGRTCQSCTSDCCTWWVLHHLCLDFASRSVSISGLIFLHCPISLDWCAFRPSAHLRSSTLATNFWGLNACRC
ncbi:hypothetical protein M758_6G197900, partial [Ceratodon purpureus]